MFADDGETPNNSKWALIVYRSPVDLTGNFDSAAVLEDLFALNSWSDSWRDGVYDFLHFHTHRHEALGIARGNVEVAFGGAKGKIVRLNVGDVAILPAGTGHRRVEASDDLLVVGAYPQNSGAYDQPEPRGIDHQGAITCISRVPRPVVDPVCGPPGPLLTLWHQGPANL